MRRLLFLTLLLAGCRDSVADHSDRMLCRRAGGNWRQEGQYCAFHVQLDSTNQRALIQAIDQLGSNIYYGLVSIEPCHPEKEPRK